MFKSCLKHILLHSKVQYLFWLGQQDLCDLAGREKAPAFQAAGDNLVSSMGSEPLLLFLVLLQGLGAQLGSLGGSWESVAFGQAETRA